MPKTKEFEEKKNFLMISSDTAKKKMIVTHG